MIFIIIVEGEEISIMFVKADNQQAAEKLAGVEGITHSIYQLYTSTLLTLQESKQAFIVP